MSLLNLPDDVLEKILSYISFDEVSHCRLICRRMNSISKRVLNGGFYRVEKYHAQCLKNVKSQLPRRESERRKHPLARHCDILTAVETRLSLLGMTFMKFIEANICCFIPGKVLDEIFKVLRYVTNEQSPVRAHEVLQELRDLSSMAMEHFDEKICPAFRKSKETGPTVGSTYFDCSYSESRKIHGRELPMTEWMRSITVGPQLRFREQKLHHFKNAIRRVGRRHSTTLKEVLELKIKVNNLNKKNAELEKKVSELHSLVSSQVEKSKEQEERIDMLNRLVKTEAFTPANPAEIQEVTSASKETGKLPLKLQRKTRRICDIEISPKRLKCD